MMTEIFKDCLAYRLGEAHREVTAYYQTVLAQVELTPSQVYVLGVLRDQGKSTPGDIADMLRVSRPTASNLLKRMERDGLINRSRDANAPGHVKVDISRRGDERVEEAYKHLREADRHLESLDLGISLDDVKRLMESLTRQLRQR
jgi:DNA-binding MarR family transcriptional regulator